MTATSRRTADLDGKLPAERVNAETRELSGGYAISNPMGLCALDQEVADPVLRASNLLVFMQEGCEFVVVMPMALV